MLSAKQETDPVFYLHFPKDAEATKTMMSSADAIRQKAEWRASGVEVEVRTEAGVLVTDAELSDWPDAEGP